MVGTERVNDNIDTVRGGGVNERAAEGIDFQ